MSNFRRQTGPFRFTIRHHEKIIGPAGLRALALVLHGARRGMPFTCQEMSAALGRSTRQMASKHLRALGEAGLVRSAAGKGRTVVPACRFIPAADLADVRVPAPAP
jgi:hypothetical protein